MRAANLSTSSGRARMIGSNWSLPILYTVAPSPAARAVAVRGAPSNGEISPIASPSSPDLQEKRAVLEGRSLRWRQQIAHPVPDRVENAEAGQELQV